MATLRKNLSLSVPHKRSGKLTIPLLVLLTVCSISQPAEVIHGGGPDTTTSAETSTYVFVLDQSTVVQTGGIAGVHETYGIEGKFQLSIDFDAGTASFDRVDANLTEPSGFLYTQSLDVLFNMTELAGIIISDTEIKFKGKTSDGTNTKILLTLTFTGDSVHLAGETIPPPDSADFFEYDLDAVAQKKHDTTASAEKNTYVFLPDHSSVVQTGGFAGVHETYGIEGQFQLSVDFHAGTASFDKVDANLTEPSDFLYTESLGVLFNMTELRGIIIGDKAIEFKGKTSDNDGSKILITLTFMGDSVHLTGEINPPPGSADFFEYDLDAVAQMKYTGGTGEPNDPYRIATADDLMLLGESPEDYDKHFILTADIDLDPNLPGRKVFDKAVIAPDTNNTELYFQGTQFTGVFDGNGHVISNLHIQGSDYLDVFGRLDFEAKIFNLGMEAVDVNGTGDFIGSLVGYNSGSITSSYSSGTVTGNDHVGGLVGSNGWGGNITTSHSTATVIGNEKVGGLAGRNGWGSITTSYSTGHVNGYWDVGGFVGRNSGGVDLCFSTGMVNGTSEVGGLAGSNFGGIGRSYSTGPVSGKTRVGGLVGHSNDGRISASYAVGVVSGNEGVGGLVGNSWGLDSSVNSSFWDIETTRQTGSPDGGTGLTTAEMQMASTFIDAGWDFVNVWGIGENQTYPYLRVYPAGDLNHDGRVDFLDLALLAAHWLEDNSL
jgi:hypothetical protein